MRTGSYVDALDESFEYMVSSPTPQSVLDYYATEARQQAAQPTPADQPTAPQSDASDNLINRLAARARDLFSLFSRPQ